VYGLDLDFVGFQWDSGIQNYNIDFKNYISDSFKLSWRKYTIYYEFNRNYSTLKPNIRVNFDQLGKNIAFEPSVYLRCRTSISDKLVLITG
jgi:hypothetical protein